MYIIDTNSLMQLGNYYPGIFPSLWEKLEELVSNGDLISVKEVLNEIDRRSKYEYLDNWVESHKKIFKKPSKKEMVFIAEMFKEEKNRELVKHDNIRNGWPVADPFIIASGKINDGIVLSEEIYKKGGAQIPNICEKYEIECMKIEHFLKREELQF